MSIPLYFLPPQIVAHLPRGGAIALSELCEAAGVRCAASGPWTNRLIRLVRNPALKNQDTLVRKEPGDYAAVEIQMSDALDVTAAARLALGVMSYSVMDLVARQSIRLAPWRLPAKKRGRQPTGLAKSNSQRQQAYRDRHQRLVPYAAQRDLSFSKLIERRLSALLDEPDAGSSAREVLQRFSSGDIPKSKAMRLLDIEDYGSLILMLNRELLPLPSRPTSLAGPSVAVALKLIGESKQAAAD